VYDDGVLKKMTTGQRRFARATCAGSASAPLGVGDGGKWKPNVVDDVTAETPKKLSKKLENVSVVDGSAEEIQP